MTLQAIWYQNSLHVWGYEDLASPLPAENLRAILGDNSADPLLAPGAAASQIELNLSGTPQVIPTLTFGPNEAVDLLLSLPKPLTPIFGGTIAYWVELAQFIVARIIRGQVFPDLNKETDESLAASWRLVVATSVEVQNLEKFAKAMPAVCLAAPNSPENVNVVESFVAATTDAVVRRTLALDSFFTDFHTRTDIPQIPEVRWIGALFNGHARLETQSTESAALIESVKEWVRPMDQKSSSTPVQIRLTLEEPFNDDDPWKLIFWLLPLQRQSDPIAASDLWSKEVLPAGVLSRNVLEWRQKLLAELQRGAEIFAPLARTLEIQEPSEIIIDPTEAHAFIQTAGPELANRSFSIVLPEWATTRQSDFGLLLELDPLDHDDDDDAELEAAADAHGATASGNVLGPATHRFGLSTLLNFNWRIALGDMTISIDEFRALASQNSPLVRFQGRWLQLTPEMVQKTIEFVAKKEEGPITLAQALHMSYGLGHQTSGLPVLGLRGKSHNGKASWIDDFLSQAPSQKIETIATPAGFTGALRPYQSRGLDWLNFLNTMGIGACLADDMGLGKTIQLIALLLHERDEAAKQGVLKLGPTLLFAPTSVVGNWVRELDRFAPALKVLVHHGAQRLTGDAFVAAAEDHDVVLTSYALAPRCFEDLRKPKWHRVALDEAQKIKNPSAATTLAIRSIPARHHVALTGTPIENHLAELWSIMEILNPGLLGTAGDFRSRFAIPIERIGDQERAAQLRRLIQPFILRRTKTDPTIASELPEKIETRVYANLTPEQATLYEATTSQMLSQIDQSSGIRRRGLILATLTRLKQICNHPALFAKEDPANAALDSRSGKCERLIEMLEEILDEPTDNALIFTQFRQMGYLLEKLLATRLKQKTLFLHGGTPAKDRNDMVQTFQDPKSKYRLFILSIRAGGLGLNLTAANHVFHFDRWWNPAVESQATDRAHRLGQTRKVQVHKFVCVGTLEERIDRLLTDKMEMAAKIVASGDQFLTNLTTDQLRNYLTLTDDAVAEE